MKQQARVSSSSDTALGTAVAEGVDPTQWGAMRRVDQGAMQDWVESRRAELKDGADLTDDDRLYLSVQYMRNQRLSPYDERANLSLLFFGGVEVTDVAFSPAGLTVALADGTSRAVGAFQPHAGVDTNRREFLVDMVEDDHRDASGGIQLEMPGSFTFAARGAIWADFSENNPGAERGGPEHRAYVHRLTQDYHIAVRASALSSGGLPKKGEHGGWDPHALLDAVARAVMNAAPGGVYKVVPPSLDWLTIEDEAVIRSIMRDEYGMDVNVDLDDLYKSTITGGGSARSGDGGESKPAPRDKPKVALTPEEQFRNAGPQFEAMRTYLASTQNPHKFVSVLGRYATGLLAEHWASFGLPADASFDLGDAALGELVSAWEAWVEALEAGQQDAIEAARAALDAAVGAVKAG